MVGTTTIITEAAMGIRKNAATMPRAERDAFVEAVLRLKHRFVPAGPAGFSVYDQFIALHGAVMSVIVPGAADPTNFGHWNIGFCAWHREYLRRFEQALDAEVPGVTIPYWDWADHVAAQREIFTNAFLGSLVNGSPAPILEGYLAHDAPPPAERPAWWPANAVGFRIHPILQELTSPVQQTQATLQRGTMTTGWPASAAELDALATLDVPVRGRNRLWAFWLVLEQGHPQIAGQTHNSGHNFIGGHMGGAFSPNDPIFWLHHANIDRLWARWQAEMLARHGGTVADHYPAAGETDPWNDEAPPAGHGIDDMMWPWVGGAPGYGPSDPAYLPLIPDYSADPPQRVRDVLDVAALGYAYE